jgi:hypothetical protein
MKWDAQTDRQTDRQCDFNMPPIGGIKMILLAKSKLKWEQFWKKWVLELWILSHIMLVMLRNIYMYLEFEVDTVFLKIISRFLRKPLSRWIHFCKCLYLQNVACDKSMKICTCSFNHLHYHHVIMKYYDASLLPLLNWYTFQDKISLWKRSCFLIISIICRLNKIIQYILFTVCILWMNVILLAKKECVTVCYKHNSKYYIYG